LRGRARHARARLARSTTGTRGLAVVRTRPRRDATHQILLRQPAGHGVCAAIGPARASTLGDPDQLQYQELKTELGFDHFEGRSYPGWQHHVVITAVAYAFLQRERQRRGADESLTFPG